jgi:hypothetical protein
MMAMWAAVPPKLIHPNLNQNRSASLDGVAAPPRLDCRVVSRGLKAGLFPRHKNLSYLVTIITL